jgi:hypothetical protein
MSIVSVSDRIVTINAEIRTKYGIKYVCGIYTYKHESSSVVISSIKGYKIEIGFLQVRHFPCKNIHEMTGMLSYQEMVVWQCGQKDRGVIIDLF